MIKKAIHTFSGGMERDLSKSKFTQDKYYDAWNVQLITQTGLSSFAFENKKGHNLSFTVPNTFISGGIDVTDVTIVGFGSMREYLIIFTSGKVGATVYNQLWRISYNKVTHVPVGTTAPTYYLSSTLVRLGGHLLYNNTLNIPVSAKVKVVKERYINSEYGKIYWIDGINPLRHFNVLNPNHDTVPLSQLNIVADTTLTSIKTLNVTNAGEYKSGMVQYAYNLFNLYGNETIYSPASGFVHLVDSSDSLAISTLYKGSPQDTYVGKSVIGTINNLDTNFEYVRIVAINYQTLNGQPLIGIVGEYPLPPSGTIYFTDSGTYSDELSYQEFLSIGGANITPETLESKDNRLIAANISEDIFDVTFDARAYRFAKVGEPNARKALLYDSSFSVVQYTIDGTAPDYPDEAVEAEKILDACCNYNYYPGDAYNDRCKYQTDGATLGGEGPNVKYKFGIVQIPIDTTGTYTTALDINNLGTEQVSQSWSTILGSEYADNNLLGNTASHINHRQIVGYQRGEIYRFGIIFRDLKGKQSFAKWVADIRMPKTTDSNGSYLFGRMIRTININNVNVAGGETIRVTINGVNYDYTTPPGATEYSVANNLAVLLATDPNVENSSYVPTLSLATKNRGCRIVFKKQNITYSASCTVGSINITQAWTPSNYSIINTNRHLYYYYGDRSQLFSITDYDGYEDTLYANVLYVDFTVDLSGLSSADRDKISGYEIVRVERNSEDRNIVMQGTLDCFMTNGASDEYANNVLDPDVFTSDFITYAAYGGVHPKYTACGLGTSYVSNRVYMLNSPEINFNRNFEHSANDFIELCGVYFPARMFTDLALNYRPLIDAEYNNHDDAGNAIIYISKSLGLITTSISPAQYSSNISLVDDAFIYGLTSNSTTINDSVGTYKVRGYSQIMPVPILPSAIATRRGSSLLFSSTPRGVTPNIDPTVWAGTNNYRMLVNYVRYRPGQYGGNSYAARLLNTYISTNSYKPIINFVPDNTKILGGDTFIEMYDYLRRMRDDATYWHQEIDYFACETSICLPLREDKCYHRNKINTLQETQLLGDQAIVAGTFTGSYTSGDLYLYNAVYSKVNDTINFFPRALLQMLNEKDDCLIWASEEAEINDVSDSWLKFLPANKKRVEPAYGAITSLRTFKDIVIFFQPYGYGIMPVNERSYITDPQGTAMVLGTGQVLGKVKYLSTTVGCSHHDGVITTDTFFYFFDIVTKKIFIHTGDATPLSDLKGMHSLLKTLTGNINVDDKIHYGALSGVTSVWDKENNQVLFCFRDLVSNNNFILVYDELNKFFEYRLPTSPNFIYNHRGILISHLQSTNGVYENNIGPYGSYYGMTPQASSITLLVADEEDLVKVLTNLEWNTEVYNATNIDQDTTTLSSVRVWNEYQDTGTITLTPDSNVIKMFRTWRHSVERNNVAGAYPKADDRMRGQSFFITLTFSNANNYKMILHDLKVSYIPSMY